MDEHGAADVSRHEDMNIQSLVARVEDELKECDDDELERGGLSEDCPHRY